MSVKDRISVRHSCISIIHHTIGSGNANIPIHKQSCIQIVNCSNTFVNHGKLLYGRTFQIAICPRISSMNGFYVKFISSCIGIIENGFCLHVGNSIFYYKMRSNNINHFVAMQRQGNIVGYQGKKDPRPIYEFVYNGKKHRIAVQVSDNGYIVGANCKSSKE